MLHVLTVYKEGQIDDMKSIWQGLFSLEKNLFPTKQKIDIKICIFIYSKHSIVCKSSENVSDSDFWRENSNGTVIHVLLLKS